MAKSINFNGKNYATQSVTAFVERSNNADEELQTFANVATLQVALHGNTEWINAILAAPSMRLKSGKLNKRGSEAFKYMQAHCPLIQWDKEGNKVKKKKVKADNALNGKLAVPFQTNEDGKHVLTCAIESPTFALTLVEWRDAVAEKTPADTGKVTTRKAETVSKQLAELISALQGEHDTLTIAADVDQLGELARLAVELQSAALQAAEKAPVKGEDVDQSRVEELASVDSPAERRAYASH